MSDLSLRDAGVSLANEVTKIDSARSSTMRRRAAKLARYLLLFFITFVAVTILIGLGSRQEIWVTSTTSLAGHSKWNPAFWFSNFDEPLPWPSYRPDDPHRVLRWHLRNPLHNFTFYIIGIADKDFIRAGRFPETVFNPDDGWNWAVCKYNWVQLPFISYKHGGYRAYCGWRERGNFGISLRYHRDKNAGPEGVD